MSNVIKSSQKLMAQFVGAAYSSQDKAKFQDKVDNLPKEWELLCKSKGSFFADYQYKAAAFVNTESKEIVIANAGTKPSNLWDLIDDLGLAFGYVPSKMSSIKSFLDVVEKSLESKDGDIGKYKISTAGHSLGSVLSDLAIVEAQSRGHEVVSSTTFENPGSSPIVKSAKTSGWFSSNDNIDASKITFDVIDARPNPINTTNLNMSSADLNMVILEPSKQKDESDNGFFSFLNPLSQIKKVATYAKQILSDHGLSNFSHKESATVKVDDLLTEDGKTVLTYSSSLMEKAKSTKSTDGNYVMYRTEETKPFSSEDKDSAFLKISRACLTDSELYDTAYSGNDDMDSQQIELAGSLHLSASAA
jgi:hypothetical protein